MKIRLASAAALACLACAATAHAETPGLESGYYVGVGAGVSVPPGSSPILTRPANAPTTVHTTFGAGWAGTGTIGYAEGNGTRMEAEVGYREAGFQHMQTGVATGHQGVFSAMANLLYDVGTGALIAPYIGGGVGAAFIKWHNVQPTGSATLPGVLPLFDDSSPTVFQYQAIAGVSFRIAPTTTMFADYHFIGTTNAQFESAALPGATFTKYRANSHNLMLGIRYFFGQ